MPREVITNPNYISDFANIAQVYYRAKSTQTEIGKLYFQNAIRGTKPVGTITAGVDFPFSQYGTITINRTSEDPYSTNGQISSGTTIRYGDSITATFTLPSDYTFITIEKPTYSIPHPTSSVVINNSTFNIHYVPGNGNNLNIDPLYGGYDHSADRLTLIAGVTNDNDFNIIASENDNFSGDNTIIPANSADPQALSIHDYSSFRTDSNNNGELVFYYGYPDYQTNPVVRSQQTFGDVACILTAPEFDATLVDNNQNTIKASVTETVPYADLGGSKTFRVLHGKDNSFATFMRVGYTTGTMSKNFKMAEYPAAFNETTLHPRLYACSDYYPTNLLAKIPESNVVEVNIPGREGIITPSRTASNTDAYYLENPNAIQVNYTFKGKHNETNIDTSGTIQPDSKYFFTKINEYNSPRADVTFTISYTEAKDNVTYTHITEYKKGGYYAEHDVTTPPLDFDTRWDYDLNTGKYYYYINLQNNRTDGNTCRIASSLNRANAIDVPPNQVVRGTGSPTGTVTPSLGDGSLTVTGYYFYPENVWAKLTETFRLSHPHVSVPTLTLTAGTLGQVQYSLTNNDEVSREYNIEYAPYASPPTIVATGVCNGHATVTGTLSNTDRETTTKPRFRAATAVKTWKSDYSDVVVGDTSFEPAGITATFQAISPSTLDLFLVNPNYAKFNYSFTGVLFNKDLSSVNGTIKSRQTVLAYSFSEGANPGIGDMRKHYKLVGSLTYTEPSTNQEVSLDTNYSYGGVFTSDEILLNDNYYSTDGEKGSGYYRQFTLSNRSALAVRYALNTTSTANLTTLNRNATVPFTYSTTTSPILEYIYLYYTDTTLLAYKKSMSASVAPALTPSFSATLGTPSILRYPISFSFIRDRAQKCQVAFVVEGNDGVRKNFGPANSVIGESIYSDDVSSFTNNRASLQLTLKGRTATTDSTLSTPQTVTLTLQFREPVILLQSGLGQVLVHNYNAFPVSARIIIVVDGSRSTNTYPSFEARSNKSIRSFSSSSRVYAETTFTIKDYYTGKTETVSASVANYTIGKLTARGSPWVVEEEQSTYVAYNNPNPYSLTVKVVQTRYGSDGSVLGTNSQTKTIPANDGIEFTFQDSGTYQVYSVEYTTDGYVRGTGPSQSYGTPPEPDTTTTTTTTTTTE